jgi:DNA-binding transcriptional LysR family regulator
LFREQGNSPKIRFETTSGAVACQLASRGLGLAVADPFVARSSVATRLVMRRFRPAIALPYGILFPTWQPRSEAIAELAALIAEAGRKHAAALMRGLRRAATLPPDDATG